jgi:hypothetical protein
MEEKLNRKVRACFHALQVKEGDIVITSGENCEAFYVVHQGEVGVYAEPDPTNRCASNGKEDGAEGFNSLALDASSYELHAMKEEHAESASSATPLVSQSTATPLGFKTPLTSPIVSVADGRAERQEDADVIEYSRKGFPSVFCSETSGWIQVISLRVSLPLDVHKKEISPPAPLCDEPDGTVKTGAQTKKRPEVGP